MQYRFLSGHHQVIENFVIRYKINCLFILWCCFGMEREKLRSQFNRLFWLGVVHLGDVVDNESQRLSELEDAKWWLCISPNYGFIGEKLQDIPLLHGSLLLKTNVAPWVDWRLPDGTRLLQVATNILYHHAMASLSWLSPKANKL